MAAGRDDGPTPPLTAPRPCLPLSLLSQASEMPDGEWATQYCPIGMHCGFAKNGCPVRLPRHFLDAS